MVLSFYPPSHDDYCSYRVYLLLDYAQVSIGWRDNEQTLLLPTCTTTDCSGDDSWPERLGKLKVPNNKEMIISVSGVINLVTFTEAKGQNKGGEVTATAEAGVRGQVVLYPDDANIGFDVACIPGLFEDNGAIVAQPGQVPFSTRIQQLSVDTNLDCVISDKETGEESDQLDCAINGYVEVGLKLESSAAHSFNFVAVDLESDVYNIWVCWTGEVGGGVAVDAYTENDAGDTVSSGKVSALAAIGQRVVIAQQVRAVKEQEFLGDA